MAQRMLGIPSRLSHQSENGVNITKKEIFHVAHPRLPHAKQAAAEVAVRCDVLANYARGDCYHGGAPLMTSYPNEDEGPDEVNWTLHVQPDDCVADHKYSLWQEGEIAILANGDGDKLEEIVRSVNAVPDLIAALDQISGVCEDNAPDSCDKKMALDFVRQVAAAALAKVKP
jgi:hypothetical protein